MPGADLDFAKEMAEFMRKSIESLETLYEDKELRVTASFGIYIIKSLENRTVVDLLKNADEKLYLAKRNGRNRIEF